MNRVSSSKGYCSTSKIYDYKHIKSVGLNCPHRHGEYFWPARVKNNHCIIGDSIVKFLKITNQADVIAYPGITVDKLFWKIKLAQIDCKSYKIIVIHVGTNDLSGNDIKTILLKYKRLIKLVQSVNSSAVIGVSSILPKPCETEEENERIITLNREVKTLCSDHKVHFIPSYRPFVAKAKKINIELFARDKLHLNFKGSVKLRNCLVGNIKSLQGISNN